MIGFVKGQIELKREDTVVIETSGGVGYEIKVPGTVMEQLGPVGEVVKIYTHTYIREDIVALYGFLNRRDLETFRLLITVNGIGPKAALSILTVLSPEDLRFAVLSDDAKAIAKAPGVGAKTASKLILEIKDKIVLIAPDEFIQHENPEVDGAQDTAGGVASDGKLLHGLREDAALALEALGYSKTEAHKAVAGVELTETMTVEDVLKLSLKRLI